MELDLERLPNHVAIILDGNGRWAKERGKPRFVGHRHGAFTLRDIAKYANKIGIKYLTVFCFSTENWKRDKDEVTYLMHKPVQFFKHYHNYFISRDVRYKFIGRRDRLPIDLLNCLESLEEETKNNKGLTLTLCIDYGSYEEITSAVKKIASDVKNNKLDIDDITPELIEDNLYTKGYPKLDLLIRTSGEVRISNFLLWQLGYAELYFTNTYFPDFKEDEFKKALIDYQSRSRRFGGLKNEKSN